MELSKIKIILICFINLLYLFPCLAQDTLKISQNDSIPEDTIQEITDEDNFDFILAAEKGDTNEVIRLLKKGVDVDTKTDLGITPLMFAAQKGHYAIVRILLDNGADVNTEPSTKATALIGSALYNRFDIAEMLIRKGANINAADLDSVTALMYATAYDYFSFSDMLIYYDASINQKDQYGNNAIIVASFNDNIDIVDLLIKKGANINSSDREGFTPLIIACQNGDTTLVRFLQENGADINFKNKDNLSGLDIAIINQNIDIIKLLILYGAKVDYQINSSVSPLTLAKQYSTRDVKSLLKQNGARSDVKPTFTRILIGIDMPWNFNDFMCGLNAGIYESKYNIEFFLGFDTRLAAKRILQKQSDHIYYQYWEKRSFFFLEMDKMFNLYKSRNRKVLGLFLGGKEIYTFGKYRGASSKPDAEFIFVPQFGIFWNGIGGGIKLNYEFMNFDTYKVSPHRVNLTFNFHVKLRKDNYNFRNKRIIWLEK